jgi:hypothetical protein
VAEILKNAHLLSRCTEITYAVCILAVGDTIIHWPMALALVALAFVFAGPAAAQNLLIRNVRIITGTGQVIEQGLIIVNAR